MNEQVKVEQRHRDAAADYGRVLYSISSKEAAGIRRGDWDDLERVQWFARFEQEHLSSGSGEPAIPAGFVAVPIKPTPAMRDAALQELSGPTDFDPKVAAWDAIRAYRAMLSAAPRAEERADG